MTRLLHHQFADRENASGITALVFDLDGVLVSSRGLHEDAFLEAASAAGIMVDRTFHAQHLDGLPTKEKLARLHVPLEQRSAIYRHKKQLTAERTASHLIWNDGVRDLLADLQSRGYGIGIASNASGYFCRCAVKLLQVEAVIDCLITNEDVRKPKPDPEMYMLAMERLGSVPAQTLVFEDARFGLASAFAAGARVCHVTDPTHLTRDRINKHLMAYGETVEAEND